VRWPNPVPVYHMGIPIQLELFDDDQYGEFHETQDGYSIGVTPGFESPGLSGLSEITKRLSATDSLRCSAN